MRFAQETARPQGGAAQKDRGGQKDQDEQKKGSEEEAVASVTQAKETDREGGGQAETSHCTATA
jgi:hypothetical protein